MSGRGDRGREQAAQQRVVRRDLTMYGRVLQLPDLPGFAAVSERDFAKDLRACRPEPLVERSKKPVETTGLEHPQFIWALETATFANADAPDEFAICPPAQAMNTWLWSRLAVAQEDGASKGATTKGSTRGRKALGNSALAPGGAACNRLNIALTLKQRMAMATLRREERNSKFFDLRKKYIALLRQNQDEHREQIGAISSLRAALHKAGISADQPRSRSQMNRRIVVLSQQCAELRRRLGASRSAATPDASAAPAPVASTTPVFVSGDEVTTAYGPGVVRKQRDNSGMCAVSLCWGAVVYCMPAELRLRDPLARARPQRSPSARTMPSPSRSNKRKADSTSILDLQRDGGAKAARQRKLGEEEALAAVASEMDFEEKRRKEVLQTAEVHVVSHVPMPERGLALRLDPVRGKSKTGFVHGIRGDGGSPRRTRRGAGHSSTRTGVPRTPMSPAQRPIQRTRSFNTPAAFEELQKLKAEVRRLKWKLKLTEDERNEQRNRLTEAREAQSKMLRQVNALRAEVMAGRAALDQQLALTSAAEQAAAAAKAALSNATHVNGNPKLATTSAGAVSGEDDSPVVDEEVLLARRSIRRSGSMSAMVEAAEAAAADPMSAAELKTLGLAALRPRRSTRGGGATSATSGVDDEDEEMDEEMASYRVGDEDGSISGSEDGDGADADADADADVDAAAAAAAAATTEADAEAIEDIMALSRGAAPAESTDAASAAASVASLPVQAAESVASSTTRRARGSRGRTSRASGTTKAEPVASTTDNAAEAGAPASVLAVAAAAAEQPPQRRRTRRGAAWKAEAQEPTTRSRRAPSRSRSRRRK